MRMVDVQQRHEWHAIASIEDGPMHTVAACPHGTALRTLVSATAEPPLLANKPLHRAPGAHGPGRWLGQRKNVRVGSCGSCCGKVRLPGVFPDSRRPGLCSLARLGIVRQT